MFKCRDLDNNIEDLSDFIWGFDLWVFNFPTNPKLIYTDWAGLTCLYAGGSSILAWQTIPVTKLFQFGLQPNRTPPLTRVPKDRL